MEQYRSPLPKRESEALEKIKKISEAYRVLGNPSKREEYDFRRRLKRSILKKIDERRQKGYDRKRLIIPAGVVLLLLIGGFFVFKVAQLTFQQKPAPGAPARVPEAENVTSASKSVPGKISKATDQKSSQTVPEQIVKSQETIPPVAKLHKKEFEAEEKIAKETLKIEKSISREIPKPEVSKDLKRMSDERPKVEEPKPVSTERQPAVANVPVSERAQKPEVAIVNETEKPKATPKEVPKEVSRPLPKEESQTILQERPIAQPSRPIEPKPTDQKSQVAQIPPAKPAAPIAAIPPMPHPFVKEPEVKEFLAKYVDRYRQRDIEGFLLLFSPMAIQNQKDGIEEIRKIYSRQFELYERLNYQLKNPKIEILEKSVKVRASYEIEQFSKKGETKQLQGEVDWTLFKEGGELKILTIQYRHDKTR